MEGLNWFRFKFVKGSARCGGARQGEARILTSEKDDIRMGEAQRYIEERRRKPLITYEFDPTVAEQRAFEIIEMPSLEFPQMAITVPDEWPYIELAPLYDAHIGADDCDVEKLVRDIEWMAAQPYVLSWNGGDFWDNAITNSVAKPQSNDLTPNEQYDIAKHILNPIRHKIMFAITGNHEARTLRAADFDIAKLFNQSMGIPYSIDYMFCQIRWRGNRFRLVAHHGSGAAQTPGAQRNAARKDLPWLPAVDLIWTGHLHQPMSDAIYQTDIDPATGELTERSCMCIISPSYLRYFGSYAATKRMAPGVRGLTVVRLQEDGRIDTSLHAKGKRF